MNYSKALIDLIAEARRRVPVEHKPSIKLANPDVLHELERLYHDSTDHVLKAIIKEAFNIAGDPWSGRLEAEPESAETDTPASDNAPRYTTRVYRGQTQLVEVTQEPEEGYIEAARPKKVYRGQVVS